MSADPVRLRALKTLCRIDAGESMDSVLDEALNATDEGSGRAFLSELVRGTLRLQGRYDHIIARFARRKPPRDPALLALLRLSLHQLTACDSVPAYAALHQAGELCRHRPGRRLVPFVNGLLQAVVRFLDGKNNLPGEGLRDLFPDPREKPLDYLETWHSHPRWLVKRWLARHGFELAESICRANNRAPALFFHVLEPADPAAVAGQLADEGVVVSRVEAMPRALRLDSRSGRSGRSFLVELLDRYRCLIVQDSSVQMATAWLTDGCRGSLLDLCAAPGGKALHLRAGRPLEERVIAADLDPGRLKLTGQNVRRVGAGDLPLVCCDALSPSFPDASFDVVLLDGPCSGTGVLRHHPEGRWRLASKTPARRGARLLTLARRAARLVAPGGWLLYATCSLEPEENESVVRALLEAEPTLEAGGAKEDSWTKRWFQCTDGGDGFFAARLRRRSE